MHVYCQWIDVSFEIGRMKKYTVIQCQNRTKVIPLIAYHILVCIFTGASRPCGQSISRDMYPGLALLLEVIIT